MFDSQKQQHAFVCAALDWLCLLSPKAFLFYPVHCLQPHDHFEIAFIVTLFAILNMNRDSLDEDFTRLRKLVTESNQP